MSSSKSASTSIARNSRLSSFRRRCLWLRLRGALADSSGIAGASARSVMDQRAQSAQAKKGGAHADHEAPVRSAKFRDIRSSSEPTGEGSMRYAWAIPLLALGGCSHAEMSATTPPPNAIYVAPSSLTEADAKAVAIGVCGYYHSEPTVPAGNADTLLRFECTGRARGGRSLFVERIGF